MIRMLVLSAVMVLAACNRDAPPDSNAVVSNASAVAQSGEYCAQPTVEIADARQSFGSDSALLNETRASFATAFKSACAKGLLEQKELFDPKAEEQGRLFLINAPEANVASIYLSEIDGRRMVLEYPFLTTDGKTQVPSSGELEEAIYCAAVGATPEEQESTGRCLVD